MLVEPTQPRRAGRAAGDTTDNDHFHRSYLTFGIHRLLAIGVAGTHDAIQGVCQPAWSATSASAASGPHEPGA